jgi:hypothetical protein
MGRDRAPQAAFRTSPAARPGTSSTFASGRPAAEAVGTRCAVAASLGRSPAGEAGPHSQWRAGASALRGLVAQKRGSATQAGGATTSSRPAHGATLSSPHNGSSQEPAQAADSGSRAPAVSQHELAAESMTDTEILHTLATYLWPRGGSPMTAAVVVRKIVTNLGRAMGQGPGMGPLGWACKGHRDAAAAVAAAQAAIRSGGAALGVCAGSLTASKLRVVWCR